MPHLIFDTPFELKFLAESGVFEGYASVFHVIDRSNDRILPGAFRDSLHRFHEEKRLPPLLWQHDAAEPIGAWREMHEDGHGLFVKGELFVKDIPLAREALKLLKEGVVTGLSIGYRVQESHRDANSGVRVLTKVDLQEVSLVTFPANEQARVSQVKKLFTPGSKPSEREFETFLRASGLSRSQARGVMACGYKALAATAAAGGEEGGDSAETLRRLNDSLKQAVDDNLKALAAAQQQEQESPADAALLQRLNESIKSAVQDNLAAIARIKAGFDPAQPRVPEGSSTGGRWAGPGGGSGGGRGSARFSRPSRRLLPSPRTQLLPVRRPANLGKPSMPDEPGLGHPLSPLDLIGGGVRIGVGLGTGLVLKPAASAAARVLKPVASLLKTEAAAMTEAIAARFSGSTLAASKYSAKVRQAAAAIEEYLGGPGKFIRNKNGDTIIMRGDKKVRFDINKPGFKPDRITPEDPHFQFEERTQHGNWRSIGDKHRNPFKRE